MKLSHQTEFYISGDELVTVKEIKGFPVEFYKNSLTKLALDKEEKRTPRKRRERGRVFLDEDMGLLSSIDDARELLEDIFLLDSDSKES
jgi:hypothetical protein